MSGRAFASSFAAVAVMLELACGDTEPRIAPGVAACADGLDNDDDGLVDFPFDPGCVTPADPAEDHVAGATACANDVDDDGDGLVDFGAGALVDPGCESAADDDEANILLPQCGDFVDNDGDGTIDGADLNCENANDTDESS